MEFRHSKIDMASLEMGCRHLNRTSGSRGRGEGFGGWGVLPKDYACPALDITRFGELVGAGSKDFLDLDLVLDFNLDLVLDLNLYLNRDPKP